jgi:hypothetical protein
MPLKSKPKMRKAKLPKRKRTRSSDSLERLVMQPVKLQTFIRNPKTVWYGPHQCNGCGATIVKSSIESGGVSLDAPHGHHYPNHEWTQHKCANGKAA